MKVKLIIQDVLDAIEAYSDRHRISFPVITDCCPVHQAIERQLGMNVSVQRDYITKVEEDADLPFYYLNPELPDELYLAGSYCSNWKQAIENIKQGQVYEFELTKAQLNSL